VEKPSTTHLVNIGLYIFKKNIISLIPKNSKFDVTDLIKKAKKQNKKIGIFPVSGDSWIDTGNLKQF
jgi:NDP-sugar pyrophosphorylase family protein